MRPPTPANPDIQTPEKTRHRVRTGQAVKSHLRRFGKPTPRGTELGQAAMEAAKAPMEKLEKNSRQVLASGSAFVQPQAARGR